MTALSIAFYTYCGTLLYLAMVFLLDDYGEPDPDALFPPPAVARAAERPPAPVRPADDDTQWITTPTLRAPRAVPDPEVHGGRHAVRA